MNVKNFMELHKSYKQQLDFVRLKQNFSKLKTDDDRVAFVTNFVNQVSFSANGVHNFEKCHIHAKIFLERGKDHLSKDDYKEALFYFTEAILTAEPKSQVLALSYVGRSTTLYRLKKFKKCIGDIKRVLASPLFPIEEYYIVLTRQGMCLKELCHYAEAEDSFRAALQYLEKAEFTSTAIKAAWEKSLKMNIETCSQLIAKNQQSGGKLLYMAPPEEVALALAYGARDDIPSASNGTELRYSKEMGRHFVATKQFLPGDIVMAEHSYAAVQYNFGSFRVQRCSHCFNASVTLFPCDHCAWVSYCSEECLNSATRYHKKECTSMKNMFDFCNDYDFLLVIRILVSTDPEILDYYALNPPPPPRDPMRAGFTNGKYFSDDFEALYHLVRHSEKHRVGKLLMMSLMAVCIVRCLRSSLPNAERYAGLTLRLLQIVKINGNIIGELVWNEPMKCHMISDFGKSIYLTQSLINHSCDPNLRYFTHGEKNVIRCVQSIKPGTVLSLSYRYIRFDSNDISVRKQLLLESYFFECKCDACEMDWPTLASWPHSPKQCMSENEYNKLRRYEFIENYLRPPYIGQIPEEIFLEFIQYIGILKHHKARMCSVYKKIQDYIEIYYSSLGNFQISTLK